MRLNSGPGGAASPTSETLSMKLTHQILLAGAAALALTAPGTAQGQNCGSGTTPGAPLAGGTHAYGAMFDLAPSVDMTIECLDLNAEFFGAVDDVEIWYCPVTCVGNDTNPAVWTLVATAQNLSSNGPGVPTRAEISGNNVVFQAGQTYGIYVTTTLGGLLYYNQGGPTTYSGTHADLTTQFGKLGWGLSFSPREWNGLLYTEEVLPTNPQLAVLGQCGQPGSGVQATNMTPGGTVGFAASPQAGSQTLNAGPCGPVSVGLGGAVRLLGLVPADSSGAASILPASGIPAVACGWTVQAFDLSGCALTNAVVL